MLTGRRSGNGRLSRNWRTESGLKVIIRRAHLFSLRRYALGGRDSIALID